MSFVFLFSGIISYQAKNGKFLFQTFQNPCTRNESMLSLASEYKLSRSLNVLSLVYILSYLNSFDTSLKNTAT